MHYQPTEAFAKEQDRLDPLAPFRERFLFPQTPSGELAIYFCGNSLGLQPKATREYLEKELQKWAQYAVDGHFWAEEPWYTYHQHLTKPLARLVGALPHEVVAMNNLTTNLHLLLVSFYRPAQGRYKILMEGGAFPSDQYAVESQVRLKGYAPEQAIVEVFPRPGEHVLRTDDILAAIDENKDELALVLFSGIQYYTGQLFDMPAITKAAHAAGALCGFDLAHAMGNVPMQLHNWGVDFAAWCTYKYLNSGPGSTAGVYIHERWANDPATPRFAGWWGHNQQERFKMEKGFKPMPGAEGWLLSNSNILSLAAQRASLAIFEEAGIEALRRKSLQLTGYLEWMLCHQVGCDKWGIEIITPSDPEARGAQLSLLVKGGKPLFDKIDEAGVICDWREPNVIRLAPAPLYNSFQDVYTFCQIFTKALQEITL
ncbi:kynureninase [Cesiribacter andamanensis]|uniref:Kynureninase n=1 Tax=Cesiribacter andamanensis AMV16 TaxID=1279009 RepID=M7N0W5_9BACT|nr:kynureninase [Cesiribacter andamanensis]EMR00846.1 Kynureninase [Cesiribacter andamanensis AMV16]